MSKIRKTLKLLGFNIETRSKKEIKELKAQEALNSRLECLEKTANSLLQSVYNITPLDHLRNFEVHIAEHCNLNCKGCNHFSSIAKEGFMPLETFKKDFLRMKELTGGNVDYINLIGGEPLLHPQFLEFVKLSREIFPDSKINIATNAILLPSMNDEFWQVCSKNKMTFAITKYPNLKINWKKLEQKAADYKIDIVYWFHESETAKHSWFFPLDIKGKQDAKLNFLTCKDANSCIFLRDGKLFTCVVPPNIHHFNKYFNQDIPVVENDYIDIYKAQNIHEILNFLARPIPFCKFCNVNKRRYDLSWGLTERKINEWVYFDENE